MFTIFLKKYFLNLLKNISFCLSNLFQVLLIINIKFIKIAIDQAK